MQKETRHHKTKLFRFAVCLILLLAGFVLALPDQPAAANQGVIGHGFDVEPEIDWNGENQILAVRLHLKDAEHKVEDHTFEFGWMRYQAGSGISCQVDDFGLADRLEEALKERGFGAESYMAQKDVYYSNSLGGLLKHDETGAHIAVRDALELMDDETRARFIDGTDRLGVCFLLLTEDKDHLILKELVLGSAQIRSGTIADLSEDKALPVAADGEVIAVERTGVQVSEEPNDSSPNEAEEESADEKEEGSTSLVLLGIILITIGAGAGIVFFLAARKQKEELPPMY